LSQCSVKPQSGIILVVDQLEDAAVVQMQAVGLRIAELRADHSWTQEILAQRMTVSVDYVQRLERGSNLTIRSLVHIASCLDVQVGDLFVCAMVMERRPGRPRRRKA